MDFSIASILLLDGVTNGAIYALLGLATVLVFTVTRVIFIPQGEFVAYGALTLAMLQTGKTPGTVWLLLLMAATAAGLGRLAATQHGLVHRHHDVGDARLRQLAETGVDAAPIGIGGAIALVAGAAGYLATRRRKA